MSKIPAKLIFDGVKKHGPGVVKTAMKNKEMIGTIGGIVGGALANKSREESNSDKTENIIAKNSHYRKKKYEIYQKEILHELDLKTRQELTGYKLEVEQFIVQVQNEDKKDKAFVKKPLHTRRMNNWEGVLKQIVDKERILDYQEYLNIYSDEEYQSKYFQGFKNQIEVYRTIIQRRDSAELINFIKKQTGYDESKIRADFLL